MSHATADRRPGMVQIHAAAATASSTVSSDGSSRRMRAPQKRTTLMRPQRSCSAVSRWVMRNRSSGMAFMYPSLMALTVNRAPDRERARAISSFTMFFEIGTVTGGLLLGAVAEALSKQAAFGAGVGVLAIGLWLLRSKVLPGPARPWVITTGEVALVPVAGD